MNKIILFLGIISLIQIINCISCPAYECLDSSYVSDKYICLVGKKRYESKFYVRSCPKNYQCSQDISGNELSVQACQLLYKKKKEGESCSIDSECLSDYCYKYKCKNYNNKCISNWGCSKGSSCHGNRCRELSKAGEYCDSIDDCPAGYACGKTKEDVTMTCIQMYSIKHNNYASTSILCESGLSQDNICYELQSESSGTKTCETNDDCKYTIVMGENKTDTIGECICNWDGDGICQFSSNSEEWKNYIKVFKEESAKIDSNSVHIAAERDKYWNNQKIKDAMNKKNPFLVNAPSCIIEFMGSKLIKISFVMISIIAIILS